MLNLFHIISLFNNFFDTVLNFTLAVVIFFGVSVIINKNPIVSVLFLIGLFITISINLFFVGFSFIALSYILVYVGAISILFLFILMLINVRISELLDDNNNNTPLAFFSGITFTSIIFSFTYIKGTVINNCKVLSACKDYFFEEHFSEDTEKVIFSNDDRGLITDLIKIEEISNNEFTSVASGDKIYLESENIKSWNSDTLYVTSNSWDGNLVDFHDITEVGNIIYTSYGIWLILGSLILVLAMVGAIYINKKEKN